MKKLVLVLTTFLATPAHADTVTIGWWDKSIGGPVTTLSATSGPITATSPIVDVIAHPLLLGSGFGFEFFRIAAHEAGQRDNPVLDGYGNVGRVDGRI